MKITVLFENSKKDKKLICGHGLSLYIETSSHKILMDTGSDESFISNAENLNIDLKDIEYAVISHYHSDHSGGLTAFMEYNKKAKIIVSSMFFNEFYSVVNEEKTNLSLDKKDYDLSRFIFIDTDYIISENVKIITGLGYMYDNCLNEKFMEVKNGKIIKDSFSHEIALVISEDEKKAVISGCFHSGVVNTITKAEKEGEKVTHAIGGFHLSNSKGMYVSEQYFNDLNEFIKLKGIMCFTGHCTGIAFYEKLKISMPKQFSRLYTGSRSII